MRGLLNVQDVDVRVACDRYGETTGCPGVQLAIREYDVGQRLEVTLDVFSTKVVPDPLVAGRQLELLLAVQGEGIIVKRLCYEHGILPIGARHGKLVACQDIPTVAIKVTCAVSVIEIRAVRVGRVVVEVYVHCLEHGGEDLLLARAQAA